MSNVAVVNFRMGSTRLSGKALRQVAGKPVMCHLLERVALARSVERLVVATSRRPSNDAIASLCAELGYDCFRGSEEDVLVRTLGALQAFGARTGILVFGDCPLIDPAIIDCVADAYRASNGAHDFVGNDLVTTYPAGMEVEVFSVDALVDADRRCRDPAIREHGTLYIRLNPTLYRLRNLEAPIGLRRPDLSLELDTPEDLEVITAILNNFVGRKDYTLSEIVDYLDANPGLAQLNRGVERRWRAFRADA